MGKALDGANALYRLGQKAYKGGVPAAGASLAMQSQDAEAGPASVVDDVTGAVKRVIEAWHGSPHKFDKFDMSKIGSGEGAQAYGHGLYFADSKDVAKTYRGLSTDSAKIGDRDILQVYDDLQRQADYASPADAGRFYERANFLERLDQTGEFDESLKYFNNPELSKWADKEIRPNYKPSGSLLKVHLDVDPDTLLDWDKPLSEQSEAVRAGVYDAFPWAREAPDIDLRDIIDNADEYTSEEISAMLRERGIPGIRYLDGMSRDGGGGTSNYVIFDDSLVNIKERGFANPELLGYMGAVGGSVAAYGQLRQEKEGRWAQLKQDALDMASGVGNGLEFAFEALEMPTRGLHGLASAAGVLAFGGSVEDAVRRGAQVAEQPIDRTAQDIGQYVADRTGNPYLAAVADAITRVMALEP